MKCVRVLYVSNYIIYKYQPWTISPMYDYSGCLSGHATRCLVKFFLSDITALSFRWKTFFFSVKCAFAIDRFWIPSILLNVICLFLVFCSCLLGIFYEHIIVGSRTHKMPFFCNSVSHASRHNCSVELYNKRSKTVRDRCCDLYMFAQQWRTLCK